MDLPAILTANLTGAALMVILLTVYGAGSRKTALDEQLLQVMIWLTLGQCLVESLTFLLDGRLFWGARPLCLALNAYLYIANILFAFLWTVYVDYKVYLDKARLRRVCRLWVWPAALVCALALGSLFAPLLFSVSADNVYQRQPLALLAFLCTYGYLIHSLLLVNEGRKQVDKYLFLPVIVFLLPIFAGSLAQMVFYGLSLIWVSVAVAMVALHGCLKNEMAYIDPLSQLYNRQYLNQNLERLLGTGGIRRSTPPITAGIMADIDDFKSINDRFGHLTGDQAIRDAGTLLRGAVRRGDVVVRYAGDEFLLLLKKCSQPELEQVVARLRRQVDAFNQTAGRPYQLRFSLGYCCLQGMPLHDFLYQIDHDMYEEKRAKKAAAPLPEA